MTNSNEAFTSRETSFNPETVTSSGLDCSNTSSFLVGTYAAENIYNTPLLKYKPGNDIF